MNHLRRLHNLLVCILILACGCIVYLVPSPVLGDVGVQPILPSGSSIQPEEQTPIQMVDEVVKINVRSATREDNALVELNPDAYGFPPNEAWYPAVAEVDADFTMKNPTGRSISMTVWFPLAPVLEKAWELNPDESVSRIESFQVEVDGKPVIFDVSDWPNPSGADKPPLPWASFPVTFKADRQTLIHVIYKLPLWSIPKQTAVKLDYIFQTGAGWAGPIRQAKLILNLPYPASEETLANIPPGAVMEGNKARWTWKNFEPGADDDFSATLLSIDKWHELKTAREAVQAKPKDGQAWLDLAAIYRSLSMDMLAFRLMRFGPVYLPQGIEAYRKAVELLPEHPVSHAGLALLTMGQYHNNSNKSAETLRFVEQEYEIAKDLDARNPSLLENAGNSRFILSWLEEALHPYNEATATAEAVTLVEEPEDEVPSRTPEPSPTVTPSLVPTLNATATFTPTSSPTQTEIDTQTPISLNTPSTPAIQLDQTTSPWQNLAIILVSGVVILGVVGYLLLRRTRTPTE